jgi:hypothetical protein
VNNIQGTGIVLQVTRDSANFTGKGLIFWANHSYVFTSMQSVLLWTNLLE